MKLNEFNSLTELFFYQDDKQNPESVFLEWLNPKNKKKLDQLIEIQKGLNIN